MRDQIQRDDSEYVVGCFSRGRIFSEHRQLSVAQDVMHRFPCLDLDDYCIYTSTE